MKNLKYLYNRFDEKNFYINDLLYITKFFKDNKKVNLTLKKILIQMSFKNLRFNKKRMTPLIMILELVSEQYIFMKKTNKAILNFNIKKNSFIGCFIHLSKKNINNFLETIIMYLPELDLEKFIYKNNVKKNKFNNFNIKLGDFFKIYQLKKINNKFISSFNINLNFNTFLYEEKIFILSSLNYRLI